MLADAYNAKIRRLIAFFGLFSQAISPSESVCV